MTRIYSRKKPIRMTAIAAALALFGTGTAYSQNRTTDPGAGPGTGAASTPRAAKGGERNAASTMREIRLSKLIGSDVRNNAGKQIGEIEDIVVDANNGRVHYVVLEYGGFLGMGDKFFTYPLNSFRMDGEGRDEPVLDVSEDQLRAAPGFDRKNWPDWNAAEYRGTIDRHYRARDQRVQNARFIRGSQLLDAELRSKGGEDIGNVEDAVANMRTGQLSYVVVEFDPGWLKGDKLVALPMRAFEPIRDRKLFGNDLVLNVDKSKVQNAPAFSRNDWPDANAFRRDVDRYSTGMGWGEVYGPNASRDLSADTTRDRMAGKQQPRN